MKPTIAVKDIDGRREYAVAQLPLPLGAVDDTSGGIRLPGEGSGAIGFLGFSGDRFFLQPGPDSQAGRIDGRALDGSRWIEGGEVLLARGCAVRFELSAGALSIQVDPDPEDRVTVPPSTVEPEQTRAAARAPIPIEPLAFERSQEAFRAGRRRFPLVGAIVSSGLALLAVSI